jgi:hypothetical protein
VSKSRNASYDWRLQRRRCNARCRQPPLRYCRNWAVRGRTRCKFHGGLSTGPKTPEGKARVVAAMVEGRRRWVERMKAEGRKFPGGRKRGSHIVKAPASTTTLQGAQLEEAARAAGVRLPKPYRHMTLEQFFSATKEALKQLQERLDRTGSLFG